VKGIFADDPVCFRNGFSHTPVRKQVPDGISQTHIGHCVQRKGSLEVLFAAGQS